MTAPRHVELGLGRGLLAIPGIGRVWRETDWRFFLVGFVDRGCCWCFFLQVFFPRVWELRHDFWRCFFFLPVKSFGYALVVGAR